MRKRQIFTVLSVVVFVMAGAAQAWTPFGVAGAGGWDDINKGGPATVVLDASDFTVDQPGAAVGSALTNAFNTWDAVEGGSGLAFDYLPDDGGNYDVFDGPNDGAPWFNGSANLDQSSDWKYANIVIGGWLPAEYFGGAGSGVLAVTWSGQLYSGRSRKGTWHSEIFFNEEFSWSTDPLAGGFDIETVALHEIGHAVGLGHEDGTPSVMATYYNGVQRDLFADDIAGIQAIYGGGKGGGKGGGGGGGGRGNGGGGKPNKMVVDGFDMYLTGVTYADVSGANIIPEPATMSLLAIGGLAVLRRRRK